MLTMMMTVLPAGHSRSVTLKSGGTLTLSGHINILALDAADRYFVFELLDKLIEYETKTSSPYTSTGKTDSSVVLKYQDAAT